MRTGVRTTLGATVLSLLKKDESAVEIYTSCVGKDQAVCSDSGATIVLSFQRRQKTRQRARTQSGQEITIMLPRGTLMRGSDSLVSEQGHVVQVVAASERVSTVVSNNAEDLVKAAYHLGNRHVAVQVGLGWLRYLQDHVLDSMLRELGLEPEAQWAPFEPESGAYGAHAHSHVHASA